MTDNTEAMEFAEELRELVQKRLPPRDAMKALVITLADLIWLQSDREHREEVVLHIARDLRNIMKITDDAARRVAERKQ